MTTSTINPTIPAFQSALNSAPIRNNFAAAFADVNALWLAIEANGLPSQTGHAGEFLTTNGTAASWAPNPSGSVTSVNASTTLSGLSFTGGPITTAGVLSLTGTLGLGSGGTGQTTANGAFNALVPSQVGNNGKYLTTDGSNTSWGTNPLGTVTSVAMTGDGVVFNATVGGSPIMTSGTLAPALLTHAKNTFLLGPITGSAATPTFRVMDYADLPNSVTRFGTSVGTGSDDTAAFAAALAAYKAVFIPPGTYIVGDLAVPSGSTLYAFCPPNYAVQASNTIVTAKSGATSVFTCVTTNTIRFSGFDIDGLTRTPNAITSVISTGGFVTLDNMGIRNCNYGLGDGSYLQGVLATSCTFFGNNYGVANVVDATFNGCNFSANLNDGVVLLSGANNNTFNGCRFEFNQGNGFLIYSAANIQFNGGTFDRNYKNGIWLGDDGGSQTPSQIIINGVLLQRNGRNNIAGEQSHIYFNGGSRGTATIISNCTTHTGTDDDGGGPTTPSLSIDIESAALGSVIITDNELTGNTTGGVAGAIANATLLTNGVLHNNVGYFDYRVGQSPFNEDTTGIFYTKGFASIATANSGTINVSVPATNTFGSNIYELELLIRNAGTGDRYAGFYNLVCQREGSGASYIVSDLIGEIGTAGTIQFGAGAINLSIGTVASDGSTFVLTAANTTGATIGVNAWVRA